jgi:hypothetical protein
VTALAFVEVDRAVAAASGASIALVVPAALVALIALVVPVALKAQSAPESRTAQVSRIAAEQQLLPSAAVRYGYRRTEAIAIPRGSKAIQKFFSQNLPNEELLHQLGGSDGIPLKKPAEK